MARLELDELLEQLVARARAVQDTQGRLRGLLRAYLKVARTDDLETVLHHILDAARELVDAQYAALGVVRSGRLVQFLHTGIEPAVVARIESLPEGKGVLGLLVDYPQSLRLPVISQHPGSVGFPEHHPPMTSFLGVPIRIGDRVFGNLYLTDKQGGPEFTPDDEELVGALAAAAATAIENTTLLLECRRRQSWQAAMIEISTELLAGADPEEVLRRLVQHATAMLHGEGAGISVPTDDPGCVQMVVTAGTYACWQGVKTSAVGTIVGAAMERRGPVVVDDPRSDPRTTATAHRMGAPMGRAIAVPMISNADISGVLMVSRPPDADPFDDLDHTLVTAVAAHTSLALQLAKVRQDNELLRRTEERARIGDDLRRSVIQRLFAHGLTLQGAAVRAGNPSARTLIENEVAEVDAIIRDIRDAVLSLRSPPQGDTEHGSDPRDA